jgi:hypothetical protein
MSIRGPQGQNPVRGPQFEKRWYRKTASAGTSRDSCKAQNKNKRNALYFTARAHTHTHTHTQSFQVTLIMDAVLLRIAVDTKRKTSEEMKTHKCFRKGPSSPRTNSNICLVYELVVDL